MCPNREWFQNLVDKDSGIVLLGNNKACSIKGIGNITLRTSDECLKTITNVRYVPELKRNLISVGMLDSSGFNIKTEGG